MATIGDRAEAADRALGRWYERWGVPLLVAGVAGTAIAWFLPGEPLLPAAASLFALAGVAGQAGLVPRRPRRTRALLWVSSSLWVAGVLVAGAGRSWPSALTVGLAVGAFAVLMRLASWYETSDRPAD